MKFGKFIQGAAAEWASPHFLNYKALKKIIGAVDDDDLPHVSLSVSLSLAASSEAPASPRLHAVKTAFFFTLERELEKVNSFYIQKEAEFKVRLRSLLDKKRILSSAATKAARSSKTALRDAFLQFQDDLAKLQKFVDVNATGFRKILKKWDKRAKSSTKELYLSRQVEIQPCFNNDVLADLTDIATTHLAELEKLLEALSSSPDDTDTTTDDRRVISGDSALDVAEAELSRLLAERQHTAIADFLRRQRPEDIAADDPQFFSRLFLRFCAVSSTTCLQLLLATGRVSINSVDDVNDRSCLHEAAIAGRLDVLRLALDHGSILDIPDVYGRRPLHYAAMHGHPDCALHLLAAGTPVDILDHDGYSPLVYAVIGTHSKCVKIFIEHKATIDPFSPTSPIPLSLACMYGSTDIVSLLLKHGASLVYDTDGLNPLHMACREGHAQVVKLFIDHGADIEAKDSFNGWSPVFFSASEGHYACIQALIAAGCRINIKDDTGWLPWTYALYRGHIQVASLLAVRETASEPVAATLNLALAAPTTVPDLVSPSAITLATTSVSVFVGGAGQPTNLATLTHEVSMDEIPSLSLPPPIIPFRIYGHSYLEKKSYLQIQFGSYRIARKNDPPYPIRLFSSRQLTSLKLIISSRPDDGVPHSVILPLKDDLEVFSFMIDESQDFTIQFDIYPTFGTKVIGRAVVLRSQIEQVVAKSWSSACEPESVICPLFDTRLHVVGEIAFELSMVQPFAHAGLKVGGKIETYWKSTKVIAAPNLNASKSTSGSGGATLSATNSHINNSVNAHTHTSIPGGAAGHANALGNMGVSGVFSNGPSTDSVHSLITASSLAEEYIQLDVQMTKDHVPVVFPNWTMVVGGVRIPVSQLTFDQAKMLFEASLASSTRHMSASSSSGASAAASLDDSVVPPVSGLRDLLKQSDPSNHLTTGQHPPLANLFRVIHTAFLTLEDVLTTLPVSIGVHISLKYPTSSQRTHLNLTSIPDMNTFVDAILTTVYSSANQRSIIFSSFNPSVCTVINWKQPNYGVFFCTYCGFAPTATRTFASTTSDHDVSENDRRSLSIKEAIKFAKSSNFLGIMCEATPLVQTPVLITTIKESGLLLASFGVSNMDGDAVRVQEGAGVDGIVVDGVFKYSV